LTLVALPLVDVLECPENIVGPDKLPFRFFCFFTDTLRAQVVAATDGPGSMDIEYGGGFSRARCPEGAITRSETASAAFPVGGDVFDRFVWRAEDMAKKGEIMSAASARGNTAPGPCEEKPDETGKARGDIVVGFVVE
jgi:hypothetical protein